jgi:hypothetical protein
MVLLVLEMMGRTQERSCRETKLPRRVMSGIRNAVQRSQLTRLPSRSRESKYLSAGANGFSNRLDRLAQKIRGFGDEFLGSADAFLRGAYLLLDPVREFLSG